MSKRKTSITSTSTTSSTSNSKTTTSLTDYKLPPLQWWFRRVFRIVALILFAVSIYPYFFGSTAENKARDKAELRKSSSSEIEGEYNIFTSKPITLDLIKRNAILEAFKHSYSSYERDAFGKDNYSPISKKGDNMSEKGPVGYFIVDVLDSLLIMGLNDEFERAKNWVKDLSFDLDDKFNNFEVCLLFYFFVDD